VIIIICNTNEDEKWKPIIIDNKETNYDISRYGRIRVRENGYIRSLRKNKAGYLRITLYFESKKITKPIHQLVANAFIDENHDKSLTVNHKDGNKLNNFYKNLE
jgi:hypothetical protein